MGEITSRKTELDANLIGKIIDIDGTKARIIFIAQGVCYVCIIGTKLKIEGFNEQYIRESIISGAAQLLEDDNRIIDISKLSPDAKEQYENKVEFIKEIERRFGPTFIELVSKKNTGIQNLASTYGIKKTTAWKYIRQFIQSGCNYYSLLDKRTIKTERSEYQYSKKTGRPDVMAPCFIVTDEVKEHFEEFKQWRLSQDVKCTINMAYNELCVKYYSSVGPDLRKHLYPVSERPTKNQFAYYCRTHTTEKEKLEHKLGKEEARNAARIFTGDGRTNIHRCGQLMECDAWESDVSLLSEDRMHTVGRAILYLGIDIATTAITAFSISYENNSYEGVSGLFLSLASDFETLKEKYQLDDFFEDDIPSNYIPEAARCDGGPEFQSNNFERFCNRARIREETPPPRSGSLKGTIESRFNLIGKDFGSLLFKKGLITKAYNSKHHQKAALTIWDFTRMILVYIIHHNRNVIQGYKMTPEQITSGLEPSPKNLWKYLSDKEGIPKQITAQNKTQYLWDMMISGTAKVSRVGVRFKGLDYINADKGLHELMRADGGKTKNLTVRYDPSFCSVLYYLDGSKLKVLYINKNIHASEEFAGKTFKEVEVYKEKERNIKKIAKVKNDENDFDERIQQKEILAAVSPRPESATSDNIKIHRQKEKNKVTNEKSITVELIGTVFDETTTQLAVEDADKNDDMSEFTPCNNLDEAIEESFYPDREDED